jgi:hypothetical protein
MPQQHGVGRRGQGSNDLKPVALLIVPLVRPNSLVAVILTVESVPTQCSHFCADSRAIPILREGQAVITSFFGSQINYLDNSIVI